jgi:hypothetical protein
MPTPTYIALANITLGSSASSVTFSSIPATYRDLVLVIAAASNDSNQTAIMRFNGDTAGNYNMVHMIGTGGGSGSSQTENSVGFLNISKGIGVPTSLGDVTIISQIMDYSATDKHKTALTRANSVNSPFPGTSAQAGRWGNTVAITSVAIALSSGGNYITGSTFSLYGIRS